MQLVQALKFEPNSASSSSSGSGRPHKSHRTASSKSKPPQEQDSGLADFLIRRSVNNAVLGTAFHWYLMVECEDRVVGKMYAKVAFQFMTKLVEVSRFLVASQAWLNLTCPRTRRRKREPRGGRYCVVKASLSLLFRKKPRSYEHPRMPDQRRSKSSALLSLRARTLFLHCRHRSPCR